ncbi:MAG TPA: replication protein, partial [bacterium]|nr:replication protein [bacterium]
MKKAQIPNVIFDDILPHLMDSEVRVVIAIARKTFGFNKDADEISYSQFEKMTTYKRASLIRIMERLEIKGVINVRRVKGGSKKVSNTYSINLEWCKEDIESRLLQVTSHLITSSKSDLSCHLPAKKKPDHVTG